MRLLLLSALLAAGCTSEALDPMERQPRFERYGSTQSFADGRMMRTPPEGTVPRERGSGGRELMTGLDVAGKPIPIIPIALDRAVLERGRHHFDIFCATCHGLVGDGDSLVGHVMSLRPPPSLIEPPLSQRPAGHYFHVISDGFGLMASYSAELDTKERWEVVAYLRALQLSQSVPAKDLTPDERAKVMEEHP
jgi:mono/diheme cytochrome c family protein